MKPKGYTLKMILTHLFFSVIHFISDFSFDKVTHVYYHITGSNSSLTEVIKLSYHFKQSGIYTRMKLSTNLFYQWRKQYQSFIKYFIYEGWSKWMRKCLITWKRFPITSTKFMIERDWSMLSKISEVKFVWRNLYDNILFMTSLPSSSKCCKILLTSSVL